MSANPLDSGFQAGPQSPFQAAPVAPLFVRDRYGSADSNSSNDDVNAKIRPSQEDARNPWAGEASTSPGRKPHGEPELPPADRGVKAWSILAGTFVFEALIWGFPLCWGVFQNFYSTSDGPYKHSTYLPLVGAIQTGVFFLGAPLMTYLTSLLPRYRRQMIWAGWPLCIFSLLAGSFSTSLPTLIATQGIMYALGSLIIYMPLMSILHEWFIEKRGIAYSIVMCSTGISGIALPFIAETLLAKLGGPSTLRIFALILAVITGPILVLIKPRLPPSGLSAATSPSLSLLRQPLFYVYSTSNTAHSLALYLPTLFLPQYASSLSLSPQLGALLLALLAIGQVIGQLTFGLLSDRCNTPSFPSSTSLTQSTKPTASYSKSSTLYFLTHLPRIPLPLLLTLTSFPSAILAFTLWGLSTSLLPLILFSLTFSIFASGFPVLWARMGTTLSPSDPNIHLSTFGLFSLQKGVGILIAGPAASALVGALKGKVGPYGADGEFAGVVLLCGCGMLVSSIVVVGWYTIPRNWRGLGPSFSRSKSPKEGAEGKRKSIWWLRTALPCATERGTSGSGEEEEEQQQPKSAVQRGEEAWNEKVRTEEEEAVRQWRQSVLVKDEEERGEGGGVNGRGRGLERDGSGTRGEEKEREGSNGKREWVGSVDSDAFEVGAR